MEYSEETEYLCVDDFLSGVVEAGALSTALETGLVDRLLEGGPAAPEETGKGLPMDAAGLAMLVSLLKANGVIEEQGSRVGLTGPFMKALRYRDLLETKLAFARFVLPDFTDLLTGLLSGADRFRAASRTFDLFSYGRAFDKSRESRELTKRWVRITTCLTRYEAASCLGRYDFGRHERMLDIGGNSGEFALRVCRKHEGLKATVLDLPLVCDAGREHLAGKPEAGRIDFIEGNALTDRLPAGFDLISFKSMLHDWPERETLLLLGKAAAALAPGGTLLVFERGPFVVGSRTPPYSAIPILLFFRYFRDPSFYEEHLPALGLSDVTVTRITLDSPFHIVTARKKRR